MNRGNVKKCLYFGTVALFLCGVGDWLLGYVPLGGEPIVFGFLNSNIVKVPSWFYLTSMALGILSGFGCMAYAPVMVNILGDIGANRHPKMYKVFRFGCASAPMMFVSFHTACCLAALFMQTAIKAGIDAESVDRAFLIPGSAVLVPFLIWCFIVDIPITIAFMYFVWKGTMKLPKVAVFMSPLGFSFLTKIIYAVLIAVGLEQYTFLAGCGESWGHALMCLAFWKSYRTYRDER